MSAEILNVPGPDGTTQSSMIGGSKPLHRFLKGHPKITWIIILIIGFSYINYSISVAFVYIDVKPFVLNDVFIGTLLLITGTLFIVAGRNTTKKTVTGSLALSIVSTLCIAWFLFQSLGEVHFYFIYDHHNNHYEHLDHNDTTDHNDTYSSPSSPPDDPAMEATLLLLFMFYGFVALVVVIVMSALAGAALRSTKSQAIVRMTVAASETPAE
ncbi:membrane-spanning 4-domains subfamily A member 4A-like [Nothobranchius furzeri]|uniref:Membrane-spanning 4-domains subfamily A member 4A-like n=1 Tax=Nothobranchius furzeri TaxID=105023 RepID=A0A9D2Y0Z2_NOTFU|nr:membrane-spanning 4-domains subfamily A member 4A-like [Nothobranchius furzeri]